MAAGTLHHKRRHPKKKEKGKIQTPPPGIEPGTCRLTADRSANGALEAMQVPTHQHQPFVRAFVTRKN